MPSNNIAFARNYTSVIDEVYQRASVSGVLNSGRRMVRAGHNAKEILIPKISVTGLGNYTRNVGYKTGAITYEFETKTFNYDRGIRLFADVMDVEEAGVNDCFVEAGAELQRTQVAPEADAFTFAQIAGHTGVTVESESYASADAEDILEDLRMVTSAMDEKQVTLGSRILFITPTLKGVLDDFSYANPNRSNRVLERFSRIVKVPQVRFYTAIDLLSGDDDQFGYQKRVATYELTTDTEVDSGKTYYTGVSTLIWTNLKEINLPPGTPLGTCSLRLNEDAYGYTSGRSRRASPANHAGSRMSLGRRTPPSGSCWSTRPRRCRKDTLS